MEELKEKVEELEKRIDILEDKRDAVSRIFPVIVGPEKLKTYKLKENEYLKKVKFLPPKENMRLLEVRTGPEGVTVRNEDRKYEHRVVLYVRKIIGGESDVS